MANLETSLAKNGLKLIRQLSKGWTSYVYLAEGRGGKKFAIKALREKSNRRDMARRESENLALANSAGIGPKLVKADLEKDIVMMEYVKGALFSEWLESGPSKGELENFIDELFSQAARLDKIGLDHGQLAGRGRNILVREGMPVIIDFEKASTKRKVHNLKVVESFLFRSKDSEMVKKIGEILGKT